jgi:filamentous hemagglutinin
VRTAPTSSAGTLIKDWDVQAQMQDVQAQARITQQFGQNASNLVGSYANAQIKTYEQAQMQAAYAQSLLEVGASGEPKQQAQQMLDSANVTMAAEQQNYDNWKEGGAYRVLAHTAVGALTGGVDGAIGAGAAAASAPTRAQITQDLPAGVKDAVGVALGAALGAAGGGAAGAAAALNEDVNNRLLHQTERDWAKSHVEKYRQYVAEKTGTAVSAEQAYQQLLAAGYELVDDKAESFPVDTTSDRLAKEFIVTNTQGTSLFKATDAEKANPTLNGNANGSMTAEQQALYGGQKSPTVQAQAAVANANEKASQGCSDVLGCPFQALDKVKAIGTALKALEAQKTLYQDVPAVVASINAQEQKLIGTLSPEDIADAKADEMAMGIALGSMQVGKGVLTVAEGAAIKAAEEAVAAQAAGAAGKGVTGGELTGTPTRISAAADASEVRSLMRENQSAEILSSNGFKVEQNPVVAGPKNPDYRINGEIFDNYAPTSGSVRNIASNMEEKVISGQTNNIVVNLADSSVAPAALKSQLESYPIPGLNQVIIIDKSGGSLVVNLTGK